MVRLLLATASMNGLKYLDHEGVLDMTGLNFSKWHAYLTNV